MQILVWARMRVSGLEQTLAYCVVFLVTVACWMFVLQGGEAIRTTDETAFLGIAQNLATTGQFALEPGEPTAFRAPGLIFFLTPVLWLGGDITEARLANATLVGLSLLVAFHLVRRIADDFAGLVTVLMIPLWPVVIYAAGTLYPQTLATFLLLLMLYFLDRLRDGPSVRPAIWAGIALGALILTTPIMLLLTPLLALWVIILRHARQWFAPVLLLAVISAAVTGAWTLRNYMAFNTFIPVATSSGYNFLAGNTAEARWNTSLNIRFPEQVYTDMTGKTEAERNDIMTEAALREIAADPQRFVSRYVGKFLHWFHFSNRLMSDDILEDGASSVSVGLRDIILLVTYVTVIIGPLLCRLIFFRAVPMTRSEWFFLTLWIASGLSYALFFTRVRFRLPFDWLIITSNAIFIAGLVNRACVRQDHQPS